MSDGLAPGWANGTEENSRHGIASGLAALTAERRRLSARVELKALGCLEGWDAGTEASWITHESGRFFSIVGLRPEGGKEQPIMVQPEIGILGILVTRIDGVLHLLMQHKMEPGNLNGVQLSPTVQATRSNYARVHGGAPVPFLSLFDSPGEGTVLVDSLQTEQSSLFKRKRNRNLVVEVDEEPPQVPGWQWLSIHQVLGLLAVDDAVNMEARSVLACLSSRFYLRSSAGSLHTMAEVMNWIAEARGDERAGGVLVPMTKLKDWVHTGERIEHASDRRFTVVGVGARSSAREVDAWDQPMISAGREGVLGLLVTRINGAPHMLMRLSREPGAFDRVELGPTVQFEPEINASWDEQQSCRAVTFLDAVLDAAPGSCLFDAMASDEGGRFYHTSLRHLVVAVEDLAEPPGFRWLSLSQCAELMRFEALVNCRARSILCALFSFMGVDDAVPVRGQEYQESRSSTL